MLPFALSELRSGWVERSALAARWALKMPMQANAITSICVRYITAVDARHWPDAVPHLRHFKGLKRLHFPVSASKAGIRREEF